MSRERRWSPGRIALALALLAAGLAITPAGAAAPDRIAGPSRFETAVAASASEHGPGVPVVHVVTGLAFPDALAAGVAAGLDGGPVLLVRTTSVPDATRAELQRLRPGRIVVVGGAAAVADGVLTELRGLTTGTVTRLAGANRYETAAAVAADRFPAGRGRRAWVASGETFADALVAVPPAIIGDGPLLLVARDRVPDATRRELERLAVDEIVLLGAGGAVSASTADALAAIAPVVRVGGGDGPTTSAAVAAVFPAGEAFVATARTYADALAVGPLAGRRGAPILLVEPNCIPPAVLGQLDRLVPAPAAPTILGGDRAVGLAVEDRARCPSASNPPVDPRVTPAPAPAWDDDGPDPHVVRFGDRWYAYTTGTTWGNHIGVLTSDRPDGDWRTTTGQPFGSTALAGLPGWQVPDTQWAPGVYRFAGRYVLFYAAQVRTTGEWCLSVAVADRPEGPFADQTHGRGPIVCQDHEDGVIDPHPFVDAGGTPWLHFKTNDGFGTPTNDASAVSRVLAVRLDDAGVFPVGGYHEVLTKDTTRYPWQTTVDNPQMVLVEGRYLLFHTGGDYVGNDSYATGVAECAGPTGPCTTRPQPLLTTYGTVAGPGGGTAARDTAGNWWLSYHAWPAGCFDYSCGERRLYVAPLDL